MIDNEKQIVCWIRDIYCLVKINEVYCILEYILFFFIKVN